MMNNSDPQECGCGQVYGHSGGCMARAEVIKSKHCCWDSLRTDRVEHSKDCMAMKDAAQAACEELIRRAVAAERERCAKIAEAWKDPDGGYCDGDPVSDIAGQIRGIVTPTGAWERKGR